MQGTAGTKTRKKGTGNIRRYANGVWQSSFAHHGKRFFMQAVSRDEAEKKLNCALQFAKSSAFDGTKEALDQHLKEMGYPSGLSRTEPEIISSHNIKPVSYTHLDVYKRQILGRSLYSQICHSSSGTEKAVFHSNLM